MSIITKNIETDMKKILLALILSGLFCSLKGQSYTENFSPVIGFRFGYFTPAASNFGDVYDESDLSYNASLALGVNNFFFFAKYRKFTADGSSIIKNMDHTGNAHWKQDIFLAGLRIYTQSKTNLCAYFEFGPCYSFVTESIGLEGYTISEFDSKTERENWGFGVTAGFDYKLVDMVSLNAEVEYTHINIDATEGLPESGISVGGLFLGIGLTLHPF